MRNLASKIQKIIKHSDNPKLIEDTFLFAKEFYKDKKRLSGENYIHHAVRVASVLDGMKMDSIVIAFGLLHDALDDLPPYTKKIALSDIENKFGQELADLIKRISDLSKVRYSLAINVREKKIATKNKIENLRRMFLAIAGDLRVILVELISRIDGSNFLRYLPEEKQKLYALETLQIFAPVANRLGLGGIRRNLEDISFYHLFKERFDWLKGKIKEPYEERKRYLDKFIPHLKKILKKEKVKFIDISYRAKSYWSTYQKLLRHDMDFDRIHDLVALRIIVKDIQTCYRVLGIIHKHFKPISEEIDDYIARPKPNGYRSLHTTVFCKRNEREEEKVVEIQIKTEEMQREAEYGIYAHWSYKEKINFRKEAGKFEWTKEIPELWKTFEFNSFSNQVFAFTPRGDVIVLPKGATPVDFAYNIHSEIGNHCELAKVNGKITPLSHVLENGDVVEIAVNKNRKPSKDWLRFVKTGLARSHIKKAIAETESGFAFGLPGFIKKKVFEIIEKVQKKERDKIKVKAQKPREIYLAGQKGILVNIAKCCNPEADDKVAAYLTKYRAAVLHKTSCQNFKELAQKYPEKIIKASFE